MTIDAIRGAIERRKATNPEWADGMEACWAELSDALAEDIGVTREFLLEDCGPEDYLLVTEVYDDVVLKTQSREYVDLLRESIRRFPDLAGEYDLDGNLDLAVRTMMRE
jgi:hypothetical protein